MAKAPQADDSVTFENAMSELEALVAAMEHEELPLENALNHYQRGLALLRHCQTTLAAAEQRIRVLENDDLADFKLTDGATIRK